MQICIRWHSCFGSKIPEICQSSRDQMEHFAWSSYMELTINFWRVSCDVLLQRRAHSAQTTVFDVSNWIRCIKLIKLVLSLTLCSKSPSAHSMEGGDQTKHKKKDCFHESSWELCGSILLVVMPRRLYGGFWTIKRRLRGNRRGTVVAWKRRECTVDSCVRGSWKGCRLSFQESSVDGLCK